VQALEQVQVLVLVQQLQQVQQLLALALALELVLVLVLALELELELELLLQQSRHHNLEQLSLASSLHCASTDLMRYQFSTANYLDHCASCRC
jgi:hypothetical protein